MPLTLGTDISRFHAATSCAPWPKQVKRKSQRPEIHCVGQSLAGTHSHHEGMAMTRQLELHQQVHPCCENTALLAALPWWCPRLALMAYISYRWKYFLCGQNIPWCHPEDPCVQMPAQTPQVRCDLTSPIRETQRGEEMRKHSTMPVVSLHKTLPLSLSSEWCCWTCRQPTSMRC